MPSLPVVFFNEPVSLVEVRLLRATGIQNEQAFETGRRERDAEAGAESSRGRREFADDSETASSSARSRWVGTRREEAFLPGAKEQNYLAGQVVNAELNKSAQWILWSEPQDDEYVLELVVKFTGSDF